jgi:Tfp pilus assembly protein PilF
MVLFPNTASFSFYNGLGNLMQKHYKEAAESLEHAKLISLDNIEMQFEINSQLGDAYYNLTEKEKAWASFDEALKIDSNNSHILNNYSYFLSLEKEMLDKAETMSRKLVLLFPEDPTFLDTYGWVLYQNGKFALALPVMEKAVKDSKSGVIWEHYGDVLFQLGKVDEAGRAWQKASELGGEISTQLAKKIKDRKIN